MFRFAKFSLRRTFLAVLFGGSLLVLGAVRWVARTNQEQTAENPPVARVYNCYLYKSDLEHLKTEITGLEENADIVEQYIQNWISKQLLIAEAEARSDYNKADTEKRFLDYKYALLIHNFLAKLVDEQLSKEVSQEEIVDYYQAHQENFVLRSNIFKGKFVVLPKDTPHRDKLSALLLGKSEKQLSALRDYCQQFAKNYALDETVWLSWDELTQNAPFSRVPNRAKVLSKGKLLQASDNEQFYYFKINEYRLVGSLSPIEFVSDQITDIIVYKRKMELVNKIKRELLQQAKKNNHCVVYEH